MSAEAACDTLNVLFKMYDIRLLASFKEGARRPWRLAVQMPIRMNSNNKPAEEIASFGSTHLRFFISLETLNKYSHDIIRKVQARAELSIV